MKAITQDAYGSADVLKLREISAPVLGDDDVLVSVRAAGVDPGVWHYMTGLPTAGRLGLGLRRPRVRTRGSDVADLLTPGGTAVIVGGEGGKGRFLGGFERSFAAYGMGPFIRQRLRPVMSLPKLADLETLAGLLADGTLRPVIDRTFPLEAAADAIRYQATGEVRGKVVVTVASTEA